MSSSPVSPASPVREFDAAVVEHHQDRLRHFEQANARARAGRDASAASASAGSIVMLGDSLVEFYGGPLLFENRGIGSDHIEAGGMDTLSRIGPSRLVADPAHIFVLVGINDLHSAPSDVERHLTNYARLIATLRENYCHASISCLSLLPTRDRYRDLNGPILRFNAGLQALSTRGDFSYVDAHSALCDTNAELAAAYSGDGLHLTRLGYAALTRVLERAILPRAWPTKTGIQRWISDVNEASRRRIGRRRAATASPSTPASGVAVEFLWSWLRTGASAYVDLYRGICLTEISKKHQTDGASDSIDDWHLAWSREATRMLRAVDQRYGLSRHDWLRLERFLADVHATIPIPSAHLQEVRVLFLGDELSPERAVFVAAECLKDGLLVRAEHIVNPDPAEQRRELLAIGRRPFDAIFYGAFAGAFNGRVQGLAHAAASSESIDALVTEATSAVASTVDLLTQSFDAPIFVTNASSLQGGTKKVRRWLKATVTSRTRRRTGEIANRWLEAYIATKHRDAHLPIFVLDEAALAPSYAEQRHLGVYFERGSAVQPTTLSQRLAVDMAEHLLAVALSSKKLVIVSAAGIERQQPDRQRSLQKLKDRGVLLALCSPATSDLQRILEPLACKPEDAVFVCDPRDVNGRWPEIQYLAPADARTWRIFSRWERLLVKAPRNAASTRA